MRAFWFVRLRPFLLVHSYTAISITRDPAWPKNSSWPLPCPKTHCFAHVDDKSGPGGLLPEEIPGILSICCENICCEPIAPLARRLLCRFPLVVLQQAPQSFSTPHCSHVPPCLRPRRKQDPIVFALMVALLVVMYDVLLQRSPQRRFSKQDQPRQTFFFDRPHPAFRIRVQIRASCWQSKRIHASRLDQFSK